LFSIILATRNRPALFGEALRSVLAQTHQDMEIIVVDDGSDEAFAAGYRRILESATRQVQFHSLVRRANGHGQSYALNFGAVKSSGGYLCFLDDDDCWTDPGYLSRARRSIEARHGAVDLHLSNQVAFSGDVQKKGPIWIEDLMDRLRSSGRTPSPDGAYDVTIKDLLGCNGFCHLNTLISRRALFLEAGGMDETLRWECDHDLYFRLIDRANSIVYAPGFVARHNIPDPAASASMTTGLSELQRRLFQLRVFDKAALFASHPAIRAYGRRHRGYTLKRIAEELAKGNDYGAAYHYARTALGALPTAKWAAYTAALGVKAALQARRRTLGKSQPGPEEQAGR